MQIHTFERRRNDRLTDAALKRELNAEQLATLITLERFGWTVRFIRHRADGQPLAALHDPDRHRFALLDPQGELDTDPPADFREMH